MTDITNVIQQHIKDIEGNNDVSILYAAEAGSRAHGLESPNSDYDVRFIYMHPKSWYLDINTDTHQDVIEYETNDNVDINGWDLKKALRLFCRYNASFIEWFNSPIVYNAHPIFVPAIKSIIKSHYSVSDGIQTYKNIAKSMYKWHSGNTEIPIKKYLYIVKHVLSTMWIEKNHTPPPVVFDELLGSIDVGGEVAHQLKLMLKIKRESAGSGLISMNGAIDYFIQSELDRLDAIIATSKPIKYDNTEQLKLVNELFKATLI